MAQHSPAKKSLQSHLLAAILVSEATSLCRPLPGDAMTILDYIAIGVLIVLILGAAVSYF
jgi:hypothetical protein